MTVCFFTAQYPPTVGGVERYTHSLGVRLVQKGHRVLVITSALPGLPARETQDGIDIVRLPSWRLMGGRLPVVKLSAAARGVRAIVKQAAPALIVVQTRFYPLSLLGARTAKKLGVPALVLEHGTAHLLRGSVAGVLGNAYEHAMMHLVRRNCDNLYGVSKACAAWLSHFGVHTDKVLYNAVDPAQLQSIADACGTDFLCPYLGCDADKPSPDAPVIVFVGRFIPEKGVLPLLEAFRTVRKTHPRATLLLAGDGPQLAAARAHLPDGAHLLGMLPYEQSIALLARADIYCLPTFSEGFSTSVLEAAALRAAIVTTATGGSPELIVDKNHGLLLSDMRAESIAEALDTALSSPAWRATAQENAYQRLSRCFTWDAVSESLLALAAQGSCQ